MSRWSPNDVVAYRCKHAVEALRWTGTDDNRETFAAWWLEKHDTVFETRGQVIRLPDPRRRRPEAGMVSEGDWIIYADGEFIVMADELFRDTYEEIL